MKHPEEAVWLKYAAAEALSRSEREMCETHLEQDCSVCWPVYMHCLEVRSADLPGPADEDAFREKLMLRWDEERGPAAETAAEGRLGSAEAPAARSSRREREWLRHPLFHYAAAAAITLLLMSSGVFHSLTGQAEGAAPPAGQESSETAEELGRPSFSEKLLDRTTRVIDSIEPKRERGDQP